MSNVRWESPQLMIESKSEIDDKGCWVWKASTQRGYGCVGASYWGRYYKCFRSHQLAYRVYKGEYDKSLYICHTCNNPSCVNPEHLYAATQKQNMDDMVAAGRQNRYSKLSLEEVLQIKDLVKILRNPIIAELYNVDSRTISGIRTGVRWGWAKR